MYGDNFSLNFLRQYIILLSNSPHWVLLFAFPEHRSAAMRTVGCFSPLFRIFDQLDVQISWTAFNNSLVEEIPFTQAYLELNTDHDSPRVNNRSTLMVRDAFYFNSSNGLLRRIPISTTTKHRNKLLKFFEILRQGTAQLASSLEPFFRPPAQPPDANTQLVLFSRPEPSFDGIFLPSLGDGTLLIEVTNKWFRAHSLEPLDNLPVEYPKASRKLWSVFWNAPFLHQARNIMWRIYHHKLSCRPRLHGIVPSHFSYPSCIFCGHAFEDGIHFLWSCPSKRSIWSSLAERFLVYPDSLNFVHILTLKAVDI